MESTRSEVADFPIEKFVWDLTYACPLRCVHCYSESGRRSSRALGRDDMVRVVDAMISKEPQRVAFSGGEPLLVPWWDEAARRLQEAGIPLTIHISGWVMNEKIANQLADHVRTVVVSVDGGTEETHDAVRGRRGSYAKAVAALEMLSRIKEERERAGTSCYELGIDYTVVRTNKEEVGLFVQTMSARFSGLAFVRMGAAVPCGLAEEQTFADTELLSEVELEELASSAGRLATLVKNSVRVDVTDVRLFRPNSPLSRASETHAHFEPDGQLRAFAVYEAKVGSVLETPLDELWRRALAWRSDPFVAQQRNSIRTSDDWARVARALDSKYGSESDRARISARGSRAEAKSASKEAERE